MRRHPQTPSRIAIALLAATGLLAGTLAMASTVYRWKDATGQSHYSQQPPDGVKNYDTITTVGDQAMASEGDSSASAGEHETVSAKTPAQLQRETLCKQAHANVTTLTQNAVVRSDVNGTGKPVTLDVAQHERALSDAKKQVGLYCAQ